MPEDKFKITERGPVSPDAEELIIPDEAIYYVAHNFIQEKAAKGSAPVVVGMTIKDVETVLQLFVEWAGKNKYIKNGILTIGGYKIG